MEKNKPQEQANLLGIGITLGIIIALSFFVDMEALKDWVLQAGIWAPLVFILIKTSTVVIAPLSGSPLYPLVGLIFGFWPGILYVVIGDFLGYTIAFYISRIFGQKIVFKILSGKEESLVTKIVDHIGEVKGFIQACLTLFGLPEALAYGAGLSRLPYLKFISILLPFFSTLTAIIVFFGSILDPSHGSLFLGFLIPVAGTVAMIVGGAFFLSNLKNKELDKSGRGEI